VRGGAGRRLRVLHVGKYYPPYHGGMETHLHALCTAIAGDVDVEVLVANEGRETVREEMDGVPVTRLGTIATVASTAFTPGLVEAIRRSRADIVHLHFPHPTGVLSWLASRHPGRLVVTYHSDIVRQRVLGALFTPLLHRALDRASAIVCTSPQYVESSRVLQRHRAICHVLPFGVPMDRIDAPDMRAVAELRARHGDRLVLSVGRMVPYKGFEYLIRAMRDVRGHLLIVGEGPQRPALEAEIAAAGVADRVRLVGPVPEMATYLHAADVFALASVQRSEAFGLVQVEAMASGKPVVNTALDSGVPYVSLDGVTGITVPPRDAGSLAVALERLLDDPALRERLGAAGRERAHALFSVDAMVAATLQLYEQLMRDGRPRAAMPAAAAAV
jgi:glycosyltransferase involved in cell wall biosynthesis